MHKELPRRQIGTKENSLLQLLNLATHNKTENISLLIFVYTRKRFYTYTLHFFLTISLPPPPSSTSTLLYLLLLFILVLLVIVNYLLLLLFIVIVHYFSFFILLLLEAVILNVHIVHYCSSSSGNISIVILDALVHIVHYFSFSLDNIGIVRSGYFERV